MDRVGRALCPGEIGGSGGGDQEYLVLLAGDLVHRQGDARSGHVDDGIDVVDVEPLSRDAGADVRLVLMIGADDFHLQAVGGGIEILDC